MAALAELLRSPVLWQLAGAGAASVLVLWWLLLGASRHRRRRALRRRIAEMGPGGTDSGLAALRGLRRGIGQAIQALWRPGQRPRKAMLYRVPWLMFVGDEAADVPGLLAAAYHVSAHPAPPVRASMTDTFWRWWLLGPVTAIETHPDAVCEADARRARRLWFQALLELAQRRKRLPLNGIVVCVDAGDLTGDTPALDAMGRQLRRLLDEAAELLQLQLPAYLVVNGLQHLRGHDVVLGALPPAVLAQALGHRLPGHDTTGQPNAAHGQFDPAFRTILDRLVALRLALARSHLGPQARLATHHFVEDIAALRPGLQLLVQRLSESPEDAVLPAPLWRGLYFTSAADSTTPGAFVGDLFRRLLPADQALAGPLR